MRTSPSTVTAVGKLLICAALVIYLLSIIASGPHADADHDSNEYLISADTHNRRAAAAAADNAGENDDAVGNEGTQEDNTGYVDDYKSARDADSTGTRDADSTGTRDADSAAAGNADSAAYQQVAANVKSSGRHEDDEHAAQDESSAKAASQYSKLGLHQNFSRDLAVFYNRVPKCGSSTLLDVFYELSRVNNYTFLHSNVYTAHRISTPIQAKFAEAFHEVQTPMMFERHLHYVDFKRFGLRNPIYINVIREPLTRMVSWYYYRRFQKGHQRPMSHADRNMTFDECVLSNHHECVQANGTSFEIGWFKIIPYFCGQDSFCVDPTERALLQAVHNVRNHYALVGLLENIEGFTNRLEYIYPGVYTGLNEAFKKYEPQLKQNYKTVRKRPPSEEVVAIMRKTLKLEYQFYDYIRRKFNWTDTPLYPSSSTS